MSSYKDHHEVSIEAVDLGNGQKAHRTLAVCTHSWADFTAARLAWLYPEQDRSARAAADLSAWNNLGRRRVA